MAGTGCSPRGPKPIGPIPDAELTGDGELPFGLDKLRGVSGSDDDGGEDGAGAGGAGGGGEGELDLSPAAADICASWAVADTQLGTTGGIICNPKVSFGCRYR